MAANERINISMQVDNNDARQRMREIQREVHQVQRNLEGTTQKAREFGGAVKNASEETGKLGGLARTVGGYFAGMFSIGAATAFLSKLQEIEKQMAKNAGQDAQQLTNVLALTGESRSPQRAAAVGAMIEDIERTTRTTRAQATSAYGVIRGELTSDDQAAQADELLRLSSATFENISDEKVRGQMTKVAAARLALGPGQDVAQVLAETVAVFEAAGNQADALEPALRRIKQAGAYGEDAGEIGRNLFMMMGATKGVDARGSSVPALLDLMEKRREFGMGHMSMADTMEAFLRGELSVERMMGADGAQSDMGRMLKVIQGRTSANYDAMTAVTPALLGEFRGGTRGTLGGQAAVLDQEARARRESRLHEDRAMQNQARSAFVGNAVGEGVSRATGSGLLGAAVGQTFRGANALIQMGQTQDDRAMMDAGEIILSRGIDLAGRIGGAIGNAFGTMRQMGSDPGSMVERPQRVEVTIRIEAPEGLPVQAGVASGGD